MGDGRSSLEISIAIIPKVGGTLSLIANTLIMRDVSIKWHGKKLVPLTSVIVFCISACDWLCSFFSAFMSTWMVPADTGYYLASGNTQTCTAQGFITALTLGASMCFYAVLMILYWIIVNFGWTENRMSKWRVWLSFLLPPIIISFGLSIPPLFLGMYNHAGSYTCFIAPYPIDCETNPEVDCIRGQGGWEYWDAYWAMGFICNLVIITFVSLLIYSVFKQERKTDRYLSKGQEKRRVNTIKTAWQGIRYIGAFTMAYLTLYIFMGYRFVDPNRMPPTALVYMNIILTPLLGFFNSFVYFRPRYITYRGKNPDKRRIVCLGSVFNVDLDYESRSSKLREKMSSIARRSVSGTSADRTGSGLSGGNSSDSDLTSPLFQDNVESRNESVV